MLVFAVEMASLVATIYIKLASVFGLFHSVEPIALSKIKEKFAEAGPASQPAIEGSAGST